MTRWLGIPAALLAVGLVASSVHAADKDDTTPKLVKFNELIDAIKQHKGKVVVVDLWADT